MAKMAAKYCACTLVGVVVALLADHAFALSEGDFTLSRVRGDPVFTVRWQGHELERCSSTAEQSFLLQRALTTLPLSSLALPEATTLSSPLRVSPSTWALSRTARSTFVLQKAKVGYDALGP